MNPITVAITAKIQGLIDGLGDATSAVQKHTAMMEGAFGGLGRAVETLKTPFIALGAILAGGAVFKDAVQEAIAWNEQARKMSERMGITTEQASALAVALDDVGVDTEQYVGLAQAMTTRLAKGGDGFKKLGLEVRDASGHLKPTTDLMSEAIAKLNEMQEGTDRQAAGTLIFGKAWGSVNDVLLLTPQAMKDAEDKARKLGLLVGPEGAAKARQYELAMRDVGDIAQSLKVQVGNALLPELVRMGQWLGGEGPRLAEFFSTSIKGVIQVFLVLKAVAEVIGAVIAGFILQWTEGFGAIAAAVRKMVKGDFSGAWEELKAGARAVREVWSYEADQVGSAIEGALSKSKELWTKQPDLPSGSAPAARKGGGLAAPETGKPEKDDTVKRWREELDQLRLESQAQGREMGVAAELEFWRGKLEAAKAGTDAYRAALSEVVKLQKQAGQEAAAEAKAAIQAQEQTQLAALSGEEARLRSAANAGRISREQELQGVLEVERKKLEVKTAAAEAEIALASTTAARKEQLQAQVEAANQAFAAKAQEVNDLMLQDQARAIEGFMEPFVNGFQQGLARMFEGSLSFTQAIRGLWGMLRGALAQAVSGMVGDWIAAGARWLATWIAQKSAEVLFHRTAEAQKATATVAAATTASTANAVTAATAATASAAASGPIGWMIAIPVGLAILGAALGMMGSLKSAAGGMDIPSGMNPMIQAHAEEMVLPAHIANPLRDALAGGGLGGGLTLNVQTMDAASFYDALRRHDSELSRALRDLVRDGRI